MVVHVGARVNRAPPLAQPRNTTLCPAFCGPPPRGMAYALERRGRDAGSPGAPRAKRIASPPRT
jgi:hypothetical protein